MEASGKPLTPSRSARELHRHALDCVNVNDFESASRHMELAVAAAPGNAQLWEHAGLIAAMCGRYTSAEAFYHRAISIAGSSATLHRNLGDCLLQTKRLKEAKEHYIKAIEIEPRLHHAIRALARISDTLGDTTDAADYWMRAWTMDASRAEDGIDVIAALAKDQHLALASKVAAQLRVRLVDRLALLERLAFVLHQHDLFDDTLTVARDGLERFPESAPLHNYAASALSKQGYLAESLPYSLEAVRLWPDSPEMQYHLATLQIASGQFKEGWPRQKALYAIPGGVYLVPVDIPEWKGQPLAGCTILLLGEQGYGDQIQGMRFAEWLHGQGAIVDVLVYAPVVDVAVTMKHVRTAITAESPGGGYDYWTYMLNVPEYMGLEVSMLPAATIPYIFAPPESVHRWRDRIDALSPVSNRTRRIGVVWAGRAAYGSDQYRSVQLDRLKPLFGVPETTWFPVQKGPRERETEALADQFAIHTLGPSIASFTDTLAVLETLDLLITVDTSVAHLAGAAGRPVWVMVPAYVEWRWMTGRNDTPWYPSMRLFRQRELGNWEPVIEEMRAALQDWCTRT